jgi:hypothetical protein
MRPPRKTTQGRVLDAVLKKFSSDRFRKVALVPLPKAWPGLTQGPENSSDPLAWSLADEDIEDDGARSDGLDASDDTPAGAEGGAMSTRAAVVADHTEPSSVVTPLRRTSRRGRAAQSSAAAPMGAATRSSRSTRLLRSHGAGRLAMAAS